MQQSIQFETVINEHIARDIPEIAPLLGHRVQLIALDMGQPNAPVQSKKLTFEEYLATRPKWPKDRPPITLEEMEEAIVKGALDSAKS
ncbi:MAG: hypothetical protein H7842_10490 [Gammaproteobacteria bacterium SHHR-1]|uniref:hypothetical protein n=1 Tax=Magnetovirga frankeli TaxID=947516 RepID=UPI0012941025|nr:hypothetical protein D5125_00425 [gamma proteobacterium SS-5]